MLHKYLIAVYMPGGGVIREVTEYGTSSQHARERVAEKFNTHISWVREIGQVA